MHNVWYIPVRRIQQPSYHPTVLCCVSSGEGDTVPSIPVPSAYLVSEMHIVSVGHCGRHRTNVLRSMALEQPLTAVVRGGTDEFMCSIKNNQVCLYA